MKRKNKIRVSFGINCDAFNASEINSKNDGTGVPEMMCDGVMFGVEQGAVYEEIKGNTAPYSCAIVSEGWPSWLSVVLAQNIEPIRIYSGFMKRDQRFFPNNLFKIWKHIKHMSLKLLNKLDVVFISGSLSFIADINKLINVASKVVGNKYCNYRFDNKSNLGGVRAAENAQKNQQAP